MKILDFKTIEGMNISTQRVYDWCNDVWKMKDKCVLPAKMKMWQGTSGRYITMPCVIPEMDIAGLKFIARNVDDVNGIPARNSHIMIQRCSQLGLLTVEDGIWITNMRTAAIAVHSVVNYAKSNAETIGIMGLGLAGRAFMKVLGDVYTNPLHVKILRYKDQADTFLERFNDSYPQFDYQIVDTYEEICSCDIVVSAVGYARSEFVADDVFKPGCLVIPIQTSGFQNCDLAFDKVIIDDHEHVKSYKYYDLFKHKTAEVSLIEKGEITGRDNDQQKIVAYCGGIALHDLYLGYKVYELACELGIGNDLVMEYPETRLWV